jgi:hypothetical protein
LLSVRIATRIGSQPRSNIFLFTDEAALAAINPLDMEWISGKKERVRIAE